MTLAERIALFAALCGAAPVPASSGKTTRHRLSRSGHRGANNALHRIALACMPKDAPTQAGAARQAPTGRFKPEPWTRCRNWRSCPNRRTWTRSKPRSGADGAPLICGTCSREPISHRLRRRVHFSGHKGRSSTVIPLRRYGRSPAMRALLRVGIPCWLASLSRSRAPHTDFPDTEMHPLPISCRGPHSTDGGARATCRTGCLFLVLRFRLRYKRLRHKRFGLHDRDRRRRCLLDWCRQRRQSVRRAHQRPSGRAVLRRGGTRRRHPLRQPRCLPLVVRALPRVARGETHALGRRGGLPGARSGRHARPMGNSAIHIRRNGNLATGSAAQQRIPIGTSRAADYDQAPDVSAQVHADRGMPVFCASDNVDADAN